MTAIAATLLSVALLGKAGEVRALEGCYLLARVHSVDAGLEDGEWLGSSFLDKEVVRCLEPGGGVVERRQVAVFTPWGGRYLRRTVTGAWTARRAALRIAWDSGEEGEWPIEPFPGGINLGGEPWRRIDRDPAGLWAEAEADAAAEVAEADGEEMDDEEAGAGTDDGDEGWDEDVEAGEPTEHDGAEDEEEP